jgi:hypothetical protein
MERSKRRDKKFDATRKRDEINGKFPTLVM